MFSTFLFSPTNRVLGPACEACGPYLSEQPVPRKKAKDVVGPLSSSVPQASWVPSVGWRQKRCRAAAGSCPVLGGCGGGTPRGSQHTVAPRSRGWSRFSRRRVCWRTQVRLRSRSLEASVVWLPADMFSGPMACGRPGSGRAWAPGWPLVTGMRSTHLGELWETAEGKTVSVPHVPRTSATQRCTGPGCLPPSPGTAGDPQRSSSPRLAPQGCRPERV